MGERPVAPYRQVVFHVHAGRLWQYVVDREGAVWARDFHGGGSPNPWTSVE